MTPTNSSKIFIGMPVYNGERFLKEALESLRVQTFTDWRIFISDDASSDSTPEICKSFADKDPRIIYHRQKKNLGMFPNFKFLLDQADSTYFMLAAQDDVWGKEFLETCVKNLEKYPTRGVATTGLSVLSADNKIVRTLPLLPHLSGKASMWTVAKYIRDPEILGKGNIMYGLYRLADYKKAWATY